VNKAGKFVIMGVCGCGKSTIGAALAQQIGADFIDGDSLHPEQNIAKMSAGQALDDTDRAPWLDKVGATLGAAERGLIIACSALKVAYRDRIRAGAGSEVTFLHLSGSRAVIEDRMGQRTGHFMPASLIDSQFAALEEFGTHESFVQVDIDQPIGAIVGVLAKAI
jgi:gluconokinase